MNGIFITSERVAAAGVRVGEVADQLSREITQMGELLARIRSGWQSESAAPRFAAAMEGYLEQAARLKEALRSQGTTLVASGHGFAEAESELGASLRSAG